MNDLTDIVKCVIQFFVDYTKLFSTIKTKEDICVFKKAVDNILDLFDKWYIKFYRLKGKLINSGKKNLKHTYSVIKMYSNERKVLWTAKLEKDMSIN